MALFEKKDFGKKISDELSEYYKEFTNGKDIIQVCAVVGLDTDTIRKIVRQSRNLTEKNSEAMVLLFGKAMKGYQIAKQKARANEIVRKANEYKKIEL